MTSLQVVVRSFILLTGLALCMADGQAQKLPYTQSWNAGSYTLAPGDWSSVPGVIGYRGDSLAVADNGTNPQTITAASEVVSGSIGLTDPTNHTVAGVAEFLLSNPLIAFLADGNANAPHIVIHIETTNYTEVRVVYVLRDVDDSPADAIQPVALQYRIGTTGSFIDIPSAFVADATSGPNATLSTTVNVTLPSEANNQTVVQLRIITTDPVDEAEWVGVDDVAISGTPSNTEGTPDNVASSFDDSSTGVTTRDKLIGILVPLFICLFIVACVIVVIWLANRKKSDDDDTDDGSSDKKKEKEKKEKEEKKEEHHDEEKGKEHIEMETA